VRNDRRVEQPPTARRLRVKCRRADEAAITVGVPQKAAHFAAMPLSAGAGHNRTLSRQARKIAVCCGKCLQSAGRPRPDFAVRSDGLSDG
jgi:hypothetical protein